MTIEVKVPVLPESITEAAVLEWHKKAGDYVAEGENLVDIETEKVTMEVPAVNSGVLQEILQPAGATVTAEQVLGHIDETATATATATAATQPTLTTNSATESSTASGSTVSSEARDPGPAVRHLAAEHGIDLASVAGSGKDGRATKEDLLTLLEQSTKPKATAPPTAVKTPVATFPQTPDLPTLQAGRTERREPMSRLRQTIARRLVEAQHTAAMLTTFNEVNLQAVMDLRKKYKDAFEKQHATRLGFMSFFVKACIEALQRFPAVNASIDGRDRVYHDYYDIGIAVASPRGLVVPVLRDADQKTFADIESGIRNFGDKAKAGTLSLDELSGGTFTITNGGVFGSLVSTPILNPPQSAILGMHKIQARPMAEQGEVVIRPMMYLALTYDHRIIDGSEAVRFLVTVKDSLEDPARLLLHI